MKIRMRKLLSSNMLRRRRRKRRARKFNYNPILSGKPQTLGYGQANAICNAQYNFPLQDTDVHTYNLAGEVLNKPEFILRKSLYRYMKIKYIKIMFLPQNISDIAELMYLQIYYGSRAPDVTNLSEDDQSKLISCYRVKPVTFTFLPPNVTFTNYQGIAYNFKEWMPTNIGVLDMPIVLIYQKKYNGTRSFPAEIQIKVVFRGGNIVTEENIKEIVRSYRTKMERTNNELIGDIEGDIEEDSKEVKEEVEKQTESDKEENSKEIDDELVDKIGDNSKETVEKNKEIIKRDIVKNKERLIELNQELKAGSKKTIQDLNKVKHSKK